MKKIIAIFILITIMLMMTGCSATMTGPEGKTYPVKYGFVEITKNTKVTLEAAKDLDCAMTQVRKYVI